MLVIYKNLTEMRCQQNVKFNVIVFLVSFVTPFVSNHKTYLTLR